MINEQTKTIQYHKDEIKKIQENLFTDKEKIMLQNNDANASIITLVSITIACLLFGVLCISFNNEVSIFAGTTLIVLSLCFDIFLTIYSIITSIKFKNYKINNY
jgi:uncharacterized Tic20 family protein